MSCFHACTMPRQLGHLSLVGFFIMCLFSGSIIVPSTAFRPFGNLREALSAATETKGFDGVNPSAKPAKLSNIVVLKCQMRHPPSPPLLSPHHKHIPLRESEVCLELGIYKSNIHAFRQLKYSQRNVYQPSYPWHNTCAKLLIQINCEKQNEHLGPDCIRFCWASRD